MSKRLEDYALIGDRVSAALVARDGSIDWLCWPRFDSDACFAALLGDERHGRWCLAPREAPAATVRRYRGDTLILETRHETAGGAVIVSDFMPIGVKRRAIVRQICGESGPVEMESLLKVRFDYGRRVPWQCIADGRAIVVIGPDLLTLQADVALDEDERGIAARFTVAAGESVTLVLQYGLSYESEPARLDSAAALAATQRYWRDWSARFAKQTGWNDAVKRSLLTVQALIHAETGGTLAAPTLGLPEVPYGKANWDYRYSWLRDSTFTLSALVHAGFDDEARLWRDWLLRAVAGDPEQMRTMYRLDGAIHIEPSEISWLPGYGGARPIHIGNGAATQRQLDTFGEVLNSLHLAEETGLDDERPWELRVESGLVEHIEKIWQQPDQGIWESREDAKHFVYSKAMAWAGIDRFLKLSAATDLPEGRRRALANLRDTIHRDVCSRGFDQSRNRFISAYGSDDIDGSLLRLPLVGFLPATDPRMRGTIAAIEKDLVEDGLVRRWKRKTDAADEGVFLPCTCWLADCLAMQGRDQEARRYFERLLAVRTDLGLLSEQWDRGHGLMGNFPQTISHVALINTALRLSGAMPATATADQPGSRRRVSQRAKPKASNPLSPTAARSR
jgi:GH15 family glucan-1,4-alpha-glucosidase